MSPELIIYLLSWTVFHTSYDMPEQPPVIVFKPNQYFVEEICAYREDLISECNIRAMYDDEHDGVLFINEKFYVGVNAEFKGTLVHEMVHYLQDMSGRWRGMENWSKSMRCQERLYREREAYMTRDKYMKDIHNKKPLLKRKFKRCK